jgi:CHAT domain-containing protein/tetratricopeptide (TPR) repeat protein
MKHFSIALVPAWLMFAGGLAAQTAPVDLNALEKRGEAEYSGRDCNAAEKTYAKALLAAQAAGEVKRTGLYYLRIAGCRGRVGDFSAALDNYQRGITVAEAVGDDEMLAVHVHGAALQYERMGRIDDATPLVERENELAQKCGHPFHRARALWMMSTICQATGRTRESIQLLLRAQAVSRTGSDADSVSMRSVLLEALSIAYNGIGDLKTAEHMENEVMAMPLASLALMSTNYSRAITHNNLGDIQLKDGRVGEARKSFESAVEGSTAPDRWRVHMTALLNLAGIQNAAGEIAAADESFRQALQVAATVKFPDLETCAWQMRSDDLLVRGDSKGALAAGTTALRIAKELASPGRTFRALISLGAAEAGAGDNISARADYDEALRIAETIRAQSPSEVSDLSRSYANLVPLYQASVKNLIDLHLPAEAFQRAEEAKARVLMDILLRGGVNERNAMTPSELAEQQRLRKRLATSGKAQEDAMVEYRQFRRALYESHPELAVHAADFEAADASKLAALLPDGKTALLDYFTVPSGVALFVIRKQGTSTYFLPDPKHTFSGEARRFREQLASRDLGYKTAAQQLFHRLVAPAMADLSGTTDWIVSPDGALWDIPFEALMDPAGRHVLETRTITVVPSLTAALQIRERRKPASLGGMNLLALGNPLPSTTPLPDAAREVVEIGAYYPRGSALVLTGSAATSAEFRDRASSARMIHLAAHAGLNDIDPLSSFVRLGSGGKGSGEDGVLTALDIMSLHLQADLVVLSACETALGSRGPGEGMIGMGWALSAAGASSSVLSMWKVDSAASREFMISFYRNLGARGNSVPRAVALRETGLAMLRMPAYRHPFYWAAFTLWGDGR